MSYISTIFWWFIIINSTLAIFTIFRDKTRDIASIWAWLLALIMLPGIGFIAYLFFGRGMSDKDIYDIKQQDQIGLRELKDTLTERYEHQHEAGDEVFSNNKKEMVSLFQGLDNAALTRDNEVDIYSDGKEKFDQLLEDIKQAKHHIHLVYYIFRGDKIGRAIVDALEEKANQGVEVRVLYDPVGTRWMTRSFFKKLKSFGGQACPSFGERMHILNMRLNYRNHRKIVVIDGKIGYTGGFNVGDDYLGEYPEMGYWRDTHVRIVGNGVLPLQTRFLTDWNASADEAQQVPYDNQYFPIQETTGDVDLQIVSSGPDSTEQQIKKGFIKMISLARESVYIQTPYLVPDDAVLETIDIASKSGVEVHVMIPNKPDHPFIYQATLSYAEQLVEYGAHVHIYDGGFLHAKTIIVDDEMLSIGTANFDIRSFKLNFEVNTFMYSEKLAQAYHAQYMNDLQHAYELTPDIIASYSHWERFKQQFSRLFSPIL